MTSKFYRIIFILAALLMIISAESFPIKADDTARSEVRAIWVDAFHDGAKTPAQIDQLIQDSLTANVNTLIVQVRRRGDAYYNKSIEPRTEDPALPPGFDALQYLIDKAHANNIEVYAWLNTLVAWNSSTPPKDPNHVWNLHGPQAAGKANWVSYYRTSNKKGAGWSDKLYSSYFLDPGNPDALDYTVDVYLQVVKNYDVDGIHLDYSRYEDLSWGYNQASVARYNAIYGTTGLPAPNDPKWAEWRREQTANLVRKIYLKAIAIKPNLKVTAAVITWGIGPVAEEDWEKTQAYAAVFQDWRSWLQEGIIDMVMPMNYYNEWNPTQQVWYNQWIEWEKNHQYNRQIVIGPGIFSQYIEQSLEQIRRAQTPSAFGNYVAGVALFAYGWSNLYSDDDFKDTASSKHLPRQPYAYIPETNNWIINLLSKDGGYTDPVLHTYISTKPVFPSRAAIPDMPWKSHPRNGYLMGAISDVNGEGMDHLKITIDGPAPSDSNEMIHRETFTDGNGWYGLAELPPGDYQVSIDTIKYSGEKTRHIQIQPGRVSEVSFQ